MSLAVEGCSVWLGGAVVLHNVSVEVGPGQWAGVVGPNGAGKSTLSRAVVGLVPFQGKVVACGLDQGNAAKREWARAVAYVPQRPVLPATMTVADYVVLGRASHHSYLGAETATDRRVTAAVLERLDLGAFSRRALGSLSGGEAQRAVLARALVQEAPVLVLDEPTTSLDLGHGQMVLGLADELRRERGLSVLCTIHDLSLAAQYSEHLTVLAEGQVVLAGPPDQVLTRANIERFFAAQVEVTTLGGSLAVVPVRRPAGQTPTGPQPGKGRTEMRAS